MRLYMKNIGMIKKGEVDVNTLDVIAGINGTGKSTIGKILFVLIKSLNRESAQAQIEKEKLISITSFIKELYDDAVRKYMFEKDEADGILTIEYQSISKIDRLARGLIKTIKKNGKVTNTYVKELLYKINEMAVERATGYSIDLFENKRIIDSFKVGKNYIGEYDRNNILKISRKIKDILEKEVDTEFLKKRFWGYCNAVFGGKISSVYAEESMIKLYDSEGLFFITTFDNKKVNNFEILREIQYKDVTIVETSSLLQVQNLIKRAVGRYEIQNTYHYAYAEELVNDYTKDFIKKLNRTNKPNSYGKMEIDNIIGGEVYFNEENDGFEFKDKNGYQFSIENVATGIKNFGILQMMLEKGVINEGNLLVLDEPENGLHPEWQLQYAKLIYMLSKKKIPIILTTHSLFMVQALNYYFENDKDKNKVIKFYSISSKDNSSDVEDATDYLDIIIRRLAEPLDKIM